MEKKVVILGGGISGLTLAWYLKKKYKQDLEITLLEKSNHIGGCFKTLEKEGFIFDLGPHYLFTAEAQNVVDLITELNLEKEMILSNLKSSISRVYHKGKIIKIPKTFTEMLFSPLTKGLFAGILHDWFAPKQEVADETIYDFFKRRFSTKLADNFCEAYVAGKVSGDIKKLSMRGYLSNILELEKEYGSVVKGLLFKKKKPTLDPKLKELKKHSALNFNKGIMTLTNALSSALNEHIQKSGAAKLHFEDGGVKIELDDGKSLYADHVFSTIPSYSLAEILPEQHVDIKHTLNNFFYKSLAVVSIGYKEKHLTKDGYGYVIPCSEGKPVTGILWDSSVFPQMNHHKEETRLSVMVGEDNLPKKFEDMKEEDFKKIALEEIREQLKIEKEPDFTHVSILKRGIPRLFVGHLDKANAVKNQLKEVAPRLTLLGGAFYGAAISKCIANAKRTAAEFNLH